MKIRDEGRDFLKNNGERSSKLFVMEDMVQFAGVSMKQQVFGDKLVLFRQIVEQVALETLSLRIPAAWMLADRMPTIPYQVHHHQYRSMTTAIPAMLVPQPSVPNKPPARASLVPEFRSCIQDVKRPSCTPKKQETRSSATKHFVVKADIQYDIYHLYVPETQVYHDVAYIPSFTTSVMMNSLFRTIKENTNLDAMEESDDEEEFNNLAEDKYVDLTKEIVMECTLHPKFKKWVPIKLK